MIKKIAEIMLYVDNQEKLGFTVVSDEDNGEGLRWIELVSAVGSEKVVFYTIKKSLQKCS